MTRPIPTIKDCLQLWDEYHTPENVRKHSGLVRDVALYLARLLAAKGEELDLQLVEAGSLLHDFVRFVGMINIKLNYLAEPPSFEDMEYWRQLNARHPGLNHAQAAANELRSLGYPEALALVVERHDFNKIIDPEEKPRTWEEKLVFYADKRVVHDHLATLEDRLQDGEERYPEFKNIAGEQLKRVAIYDLEEEIFKLVGMEPEQLTQELLSV